MKIYLDNNATTPMDERVIEVVHETMREAFGNPASPHAFGEEAARVVEEARTRVAALVGARSPNEIVFTSGGTESINTALHAALAKSEGGTVLTSPTEHSAVLQPLEAWGARGWTVEALEVAPSGRPDIDGLERRLSEENGVRLVALQWANNETGVLLGDDELARIAKGCHRAGALFHVDAVQVPGKREMRSAELGLDLVSISAHKFHGPKGVGALYVRADSQPTPFPGLLTGGPHERERRAGTLNVPGIAGMGEAARLARQHALDPEARDRVRALRDRLEATVLERLPGTRVNGAGAERLDNTANLLFPGLDGEVLLMGLAAAGLAVSTGAACSSDTRKPSHVLRAMGLTEAEATASLRFSLSRRSTQEEVERAADLVTSVVLELRSLEAV